MISIHALRVESDFTDVIVHHINGYFYPRSPCGERRIMMMQPTISLGISIHALRVESDGFGGRGRFRGWNFYPRSPCGERRIEAEYINSTMEISIHALRVESDSCQFQYSRVGKISIHALRVESDDQCTSQTRLCGYFYPRSPCGERQTSTISTDGVPTFLSTLSVWRATVDVDEVA